MTNVYHENRTTKPAQLLVSISDAAHLLACSDRTIRRLVERNALRAVGRGRLRRIDRASIDAYIRGDADRQAA
jgi:excisionase family DNA binding protein